MGCQSDPTSKPLCSNVGRAWRHARLKSNICMGSQACREKSPRNHQNRVHFPPNISSSSCKNTSSIGSLRHMPLAHYASCGNCYLASSCRDIAHSVWQWLWHWKFRQPCKTPARPFDARPREVGLPERAPTSTLGCEQRNLRCTLQ